MRLPPHACERAPEYCVRLMGVHFSARGITPGALGYGHLALWGWMKGIMGRVEHIHMAHAAAKPMLPLYEAEIIAGQGISGDRYALKLGYYSHDPKPGRHLTLIEAEVLADISQQLGRRFAASDSRRNITTRGVRLNPLVGKKLRIGAVLLEVIRLCDPCAYMQALVGQPVLQLLIDRGGIRCDVITGGIILIGDTITVVE